MLVVTKHPTLPDLMIVLDQDNARKLIRDLSKQEVIESKELLEQLEKSIDYKSPK